MSAPFTGEGFRPLTINNQQFVRIDPRALPALRNGELRIVFEEIKKNPHSEGSSGWISAAMADAPKQTRRILVAPPPTLKEPWTAPYGINPAKKADGSAVGGAGGGVEKYGVAFDGVDGATDALLDYIDGCAIAFLSENSVEVFGRKRSEESIREAFLASHRGTFNAVTKTVGKKLMRAGVHMPGARAAPVRVFDCDGDALNPRDPKLTEAFMAIPVLNPSFVWKVDIGGIGIKWFAPEIRYLGSLADGAGAAPTEEVPEALLADARKRKRAEAAADAASEADARGGARARTSPGVQDEHAGDADLDADGATGASHDAPALSPGWGD